MIQDAPTVEEVRKIVRPSGRPAKQLTIKHLTAAYMLADARMTHREIAKQVGVRPETLWGWKQWPNFMEQVIAYRDEMADRIRAFGMSNRETRIKAAEEVVTRSIRVIERRAAKGRLRLERETAAPGEETGLLHVVAVTKDGTEIMQFDGVLTREMRESLKYISQELGQFQQKVDVTSGGESIKFSIPMGPRQLGEGVDVGDRDAVEDIDGEDSQVLDGDEAGRTNGVAGSNGVAHLDDPDGDEDYADLAADDEI